MGSVGRYCLATRGKRKSFIFKKKTENRKMKKGRQVSLDLVTCLSRPPRPALSLAQARRHPLSFFCNEFRIRCNREREKKNSNKQRLSRSLLTQLSLSQPLPLSLSTPPLPSPLSLTRSRARTDPRPRPSPRPAPPRPRPRRPPREAT